MIKNKHNGVLTSGSALVSFNGINAIPVAYKKIFKAVPVLLSPSYFLAMEQAAPPGISFRYLFYSEGKEVKGFYYFQIVNLNAKELGKIIHLEPYSKTLNHFSALINTILFGSKNDKPHYLIICGNILISGDWGIYCIPGAREEVYRLIPEVIKTICAELEQEGKVVASVVKDFKSEADYARKPLLANKFMSLAMDPIMKMNILPEWKAFSDYTDALSAKYRLRCNNANKKIKSLLVRDLTTSEIIQHRDSIDQLYKAVQQKSPIRLAKCDVNYLIALSENLSANFKFRAYFDKDKMVAFLCGISCDDHYEAHHIGIDYHYNRSHAIYLNLLYEFIEIAITAQAKVLSFGRTALEMKTTVGAIAIPFNAYLRLNNYMLNYLIKPFLPASSSNEWTPRNPFKQEE